MFKSKSESFLDCLKQNPLLILVKLLLLANSPFARAHLLGMGHNQASQEWVAEHPNSWTSLWEVHQGYPQPLTSTTPEAAPARLLIAALKRSVEHAATVHLERMALFSRWVNPHHPSKSFILRARPPVLVPNPGHRVPPGESPESLRDFNR